MFQNPVSELCSLPLLSGGAKPPPATQDRTDFGIVHE